MNIYLVDHKYSGEAGSPWYRALGAMCGLQITSAMARNDPPDRHEGYAIEQAVIFAHSNEFEQDWIDKAAEPLTQCHIVLVRSAGRQAPEASAKGNLHGCYWSPAEVEHQAYPEIAEFVRQMNSGIPPAQINWKLLHAPTAGAELAFRLLCESWQACNGAGNGDYHGISIRAPRSLADWCAPFGAIPAEEVAAMVGIGDVEAKAKAVLDAVNGNGSLQTAAVNFLRTTATFPARQ